MGLSTRSIKAQMGKRTTGVHRLLVNEFGGRFWTANHKKDLCGAADPYVWKISEVPPT
jgi:hypothetical protein